MLRQRDYITYFVARQAARTAYRIESVAVGWQVFLLRHQPFDLGLVGLTLFLPQALLAIPAGYVADRFDRKYVCVFATVGELAGMALYASLAFSGDRSLGHYLAATALIGAAHAAGTPAERSMLAAIVRAEDYVRAQALTNTFLEIVDIAGPALGGALLLLGAPATFASGAIIYAAATVAYAFLPARGAAHGELELLRGAREALGFISGNPILLGAISLDLFAVFFGGATALLPVYAVAILHVGPLGLGALRSAPAVGAGFTALMLVRRPLERRAGPILLLTVAGFGLATIVFGISKNFWLTLIALAALGGFDMVSVVIRQALVQLGTPDALRGRVSAIENIFIGASNELGEFESGTAAKFVGTELSVVLGGIATLIVIATWAIAFPALRKFDRLTQPTTQPQDEIRQT